MKFDIQRTMPCVTSSPGTCGDDDSGVDPRCSDPAFRAANPSICGAPPPVVGCSDPKYRASHLDECGTDDPRCQDPLFAAMNPSLCLNAPTLILKPEYATREVGAGIVYKAFLLLDGTEVDVTDESTFASANTRVAVISATTGNATALSAGITTIYATYGQLSAYAQLEVLAEGECAARVNSFAIVIDSSLSMQALFGGVSWTRHSFAKNVASAFVEALNQNKDYAGVFAFDANFHVKETFTNDKEALLDAIEGISFGIGQYTSNLANALTTANSQLNTNATGKKVIVLITDGENNTGEDPIAVATEIKAAGTIIMVVGARAKTNAFRLLDRISSGGFFINGLKTNAESVPGWLNGLKSYICSGNCQPAGGTNIGVGSLNFTNFLQWDVISGHVDLIGKNPNGPAYFDLLPDNGLYVDLCGSTSVAGAVDVGEMRTKAGIIPWTNGQPYTATFIFAGNNREEKTGTVEVEIRNEDDDSLIISDEVTIAGDADFAEYPLSFVAGGASGYIIVRQKSVEAGSVGVFGNLFNGVTVVNDLDANDVVFEETFDGDNATDIDPPCSDIFSGQPVGGYDGYGYTGYDCYDSGCLTEPLPIQIPDPSQLPTLEMG